MPANIPTVPRFPFPPIRDAVELATLAANPEAFKFLSDLEAARVALNKRITRYNDVEDLTSLLANAQASQTQIARAVPEAKARAAEARKEAQEQANKDRAAFNAQLAKEQGVFDKTVKATNKTLAVREEATKADEEQLAMAYRQFKAEQAKSDSSLHDREAAVTSMREEYEAKRAQLKEALAGVSW